MNFTTPLLYCKRSVFLRQRALCATDFDLLKLVELDNSPGVVHNILASLLERVLINGESI